MSTQQKPQSPAQTPAQPQAPAQTQAPVQTQTQPVSSHTNNISAGGQPARSPSTGPQGQGGDRGNSRSPSQTPAPMPTNPLELKNKLKADFATAFQSDVDYNATKAYAGASQGLRFRMDRQKGAIKTSYIMISKKGGLLRPGLLEGQTRVGAKEIVLTNILVGKPALTIKENPKTKTWDVLNNEAANSQVGAVKVGQNGDIRTVTFLSGANEVAYLHFRCPVQKTGMCSGPKPANLFNIGINGKFKCVTFEENPNGEPCKDELEINAYYPTAPDATEFIALVALLEVMALELH